MRTAPGSHPDAAVDIDKEDEGARDGPAEAAPARVAGLHVRGEPQSSSRHHPVFA